MKIAVRYYSKSGHTKALAQAIAEEVGVTPETTDRLLTDPVDVLFLGSALYGGGIDKNLKVFISRLKPELVKKVVVFANSAISKKVFEHVAKELSVVGIVPERDNFYCHGQFAIFHKGHPNAKDLEAVRKFARKYME